MSYNKFLNNKTNKSCDNESGIGPLIDTDDEDDDFNILNKLSLGKVELIHEPKEKEFQKYLNRNSDEYFFNKSDLDKMGDFKDLVRVYKYCNKIYFHYNIVSNLWVEERSDDSVINRICEETEKILNPEKKFVCQLLQNIFNELNMKKKSGKITTAEELKLTEIDQAIKDFNKFITNTIKEHQKTKFATSVLKFFHHKISDPDFMEKININNHHLLPLKNGNLNLELMRMESRNEFQLFTKCLDIDEFSNYKETDEEYKLVDKFFSDICSGYEPKKDYLQKILGYFLTGSVPLGRCFFIFFGNGKNGKSALVEIIQGIMGSFFCKTIDTSVIIKKGKKNAGQASPEIEVLDYGLRLGLLSETDDGDKLNESLIKNITGYDPISYRPLYGKQKDFKTETKLCMLTNNKPYFKLSTSMVDRLRFIDFKSRFLNDNELKNEKAIKEDGSLKECYYKADPELIRNLKTIYKKYVLLWMAKGAKKFYEDGHLNIPDDKVLIEENRSYINELDSVQRFINEAAVIDEDEKTSITEVKSAYIKFCNDEEIPAIKPSELRKQLLKMFEIKKDNTNYYYGFKLKNTDNQDFNDEEDKKISKFGLD